MTRARSSRDPSETFSRPQLEGQPGGGRPWGSRRGVPARRRCGQRGGRPGLEARVRPGAPATSPRHASTREARREALEGPERRREAADEGAGWLGEPGRGRARVALQRSCPRGFRRGFLGDGMLATPGGSVYIRRPARGVAQSGSALDWGSRGRRFESFRPDQAEAAPGKPGAATFFGVVVLHGSP